MDNCQFLTKIRESFTKFNDYEMFIDKITHYIKSV